MKKLFSAIGRFLKKVKNPMLAVMLFVLWFSISWYASIEMSQLFGDFAGIVSALILRLVLAIVAFMLYGAWADHKPTLAEQMAMTR